MFEGLRTHPPPRQPRVLAKLVAGIDYLVPCLDIGVIFFWGPGVILFLFGYPLIFGWWSMLLLPITLVIFGFLQRWQARHVFRTLYIHPKHDKRGFLGYLFAYQVLTSAAALRGYAQYLAGRPPLEVVDRHEDCRSRQATSFVGLYVSWPTVDGASNTLSVVLVPCSVICVSRATGSGGDDVGRLVAGRLGFRHVDEEIVAQAAARGGVSHADVADAERRKSLTARILGSISEGSSSAMALGGAVPFLLEEEPRAARFGC